MHWPSLLPNLSFVLLAVSLCIQTLFITSVGAAHAGQHHHLHRAREIQKRNHENGTHLNGGNALTHANLTLEEAKSLISLAHSAMATVNPGIIQNPKPNTYELFDASALEDTRQRAPPLDYLSGNSSLALKLRKRHLLPRLSSNFSSGTNSSQNAHAYTVPPELVAAARIMAEANPPKVDYDEYLRALKSSRTSPGARSSNLTRMAQKLRGPDGLLELVISSNSSVPSHEDQPSTESLATSHQKNERANPSYWLESWPQLGLSPHAPPGYKVWRNVKDYGAKGDGVTDDTAAIQLAISDGGRCGANCPSSTIYPATVYFPRGTYLVSSSIVQYYNTEILGDPVVWPVIVAASSFVGLGVITSDVYTGPQSEWYLNTNNFLRSIRNFFIDIRETDQAAAVCAIHWQVAQGTSLENIFFFMTKIRDNPSTTQQGIYMENGSGGFLAALQFEGGKFGAYLGNQQFTAIDLSFTDAETAVQIHWDWGWTMQYFYVRECGTAVKVVGGAGGPFSTGQGVGSLILSDLEVHETSLGIETSLWADNSTSFLLTNSRFTDVDTLVLDSHSNVVLLPGGSGKHDVVSWGFGKVTNGTGTIAFANGQDIQAMDRPESLTYESSYLPKRPFYSRRRPDYGLPGDSQIFNVMELGAKGDGLNNDGPVLNHILEVAANLSAIVYFPFGIYNIEDTLRVPIGSRIVGQAWPQIMASGTKFHDINNPHVAVQVGDPSLANVGVLEIQCMMITAKGPTAGVVLMEWNVHESSQGSAGLWDTHFRLGGAEGTNLQLADCPKLTGSVNPNCIAGTLMLHITARSSAYLENVWIWTADHDMEALNQDQIDVYVGRGLLIESKGPTWLWGTAVEHAVLYQYQLSGAQNVFMGLVQTESPYFQTAPAAPNPFASTLGRFPNDPTFEDCPPDSKVCGASWAVRIVDSSNVYTLSTGLYSWFQNYDRTCIDGPKDCQQKLFEIEQSFNVWIYNLVTIGAIEMINPVNGIALPAAENRNGFASSILAWLGGAERTVGGRNFTGFQLYTSKDLDRTTFPEACKTSLTATIACDPRTKDFQKPQYYGSLDNATLTDLVCDPTCGKSVATWVERVDKFCSGLTFSTGVPPSLFGSYISQGFNETCLKDTTGRYCNGRADPSHQDVISGFSLTTQLENMPTSELCNKCYLDKLQLMQGSPFSVYSTNTFFQSALQLAVNKCAVQVPTATQDSVITPTAAITPLCLSNNYYTSQSGDSCDSIALAHDVSSASLVILNTQSFNLNNCTAIPPGLKLCLPLPCTTYTLQEDDDCILASMHAGVSDIKDYNTWIHLTCDNLQLVKPMLGSVLCISPMGGAYEPGLATNSSQFPQTSGWGSVVVAPPDGVTVALGSTLRCERWYIANETSCAVMASIGRLTLDLLQEANPSLGAVAADCDSRVVPGHAYCLKPLRDFDQPEFKGFASFGCWLSKNTTVPLLSYQAPTADAPMSMELCAQSCLESGNTMFGLTNGTACYCGTALSFDSHQVAATNCDMTCSGNKGQNCGGKAAYNVFSRDASSWSGIARERIGCFTDNASNRTLATKAGVTLSSQMGYSYCRSACGVDDTYVGVENGDECWCGSQIAAQAVQVDDAECDIKCDPYTADTCGGKDRVEIWGSQPRQNVTTPTAYAYQGCYAEPGEGRALGGDASFDLSGMTAASCGQHCLDKGFPFFGTEYGVQCFCGADLGTGTISAPETDCNMACSGKASESCGGTSRLSLYLWSTPSIPRAIYQGCYSEPAEGRALGGLGYADLSSMTAKSCGQNCLNSGYSLFGTEYSNQCFCGAALGAGAVHASEAECDMKCTGNSSETCGGVSRLSLYRWAT